MSFLLKNDGWTILRSDVRPVILRSNSWINKYQKQFIRQEWENVDLSTLINLVFPMKSRCLALIESEGQKELNLDFEFFKLENMANLCIKFSK